VDKQAILCLPEGGDHAPAAITVSCPDDGMHHDDELKRMRAADAAEKLTLTNP
jgi:hypothetical protein